jgi:exosome complex component RRP42
MAALTKAKFPKYDETEEKVLHDEHTDKEVPIAHKPLGCTVVKVGEYLLIDPTRAEEEIAEARLTVAVNEHGEINGMQKGGNVGLSEKELEHMINLAVEKTKELRIHLG